MRRANAIISAALLVLFVIHMVWGGLSLIGAGGGNPVFSILTYIFMALAIVHIIIGVKLTVDTIMAAKSSGVFYFKENRLFLARRISGFALIVFMAVHVAVFSGTNDGGRFRLNLFDLDALIFNILLVASLFVHLACNIRPLKIALGLSDKKNFKTDVVLVLSILLLFAAAAFLIYYVRWQVV